MTLFRRLHWMLVLALVAGIACVCPQAWGEEGAPPAPGDEDEGGQPAKFLPVSFDIEYTMVSDYIWRGVNLSEYHGEGREKLNHQLDVSATAKLKDLGLADFGAVTVGVWFEYFQGNEAQDPGADHKLQEIDYTVSWAYEVRDTALTVEAGWIAYHYPHATDDAHETFEVYGKVSLDDSVLFETDEPLLSPSVAYYYDYDLVNAGMLIAAVKHEFALDDLAQGTPVLRDITLTPNAAIILDNRYLDKAIGPAAGHSTHRSTRLSSFDIGIEAGYDLGKALDLPEDAGKFKLSLFANYSHGLYRDLLANEFYGGLKLGWEW